MSALLENAWSAFDQDVANRFSTTPTEIVINEPGRYYYDQKGAWLPVEAPWLTEMWIKTFCTAVSSHANQPLDAYNSVLSSDLPSGQRVQIVLPPSVQEGKTAISVRWSNSSIHSLEQLAENGLFSEMSGALERLREAVSAQKTIVVSGGTSSGKTTLLNALLNEVDSKSRNICIEDSQELRLPGENTVFLKHIKEGANQNTVAGLLRASLRLTPDRIMLGELKGDEAWVWLNAVLSGHPGSMTSLHAPSPKHAITRLAMLISSAGIQWEFNQITEFVESVVDMVIQIKKLPNSQGGKRIVCEIWEPQKDRKNG